MHSDLHSTSLTMDAGASQTWDGRLSDSDRFSQVEEHSESGEMHQVSWTFSGRPGRLSVVESFCNAHDEWFLRKQGKKKRD